MQFWTMFNVLGEPIDGLGEVKADKKMPIHREDYLCSTADRFRNSETGIKVIDLLCHSKRW